MRGRTQLRLRPCPVMPGVFRTGPSFPGLSALTGHYSPSTPAPCTLHQCTRALRGSATLRMRQPGSLTRSAGLTAGDISHNSPRAAGVFFSFCEHCVLTLGLGMLFLGDFSLLWDFRFSFYIKELFHPKIGLYIYVCSF